MDAVIFDFDGTITTPESDTKVHRELFRKANERFGIGWAESEILDKVERYEELTAKYFGEYTGKRYVPSKFLASRGFEDILKDEGVSYSGEDVSWFQEIHIQKHIEYTKCRDGVFEVIKELKNEMDYLGIITNSDYDISVPRIEEIGLNNFMDFIITSDQAGFFKPHPKPFEIGLNQIDVPGEECLFVGDNPVSDGGSKKLGMDFVLLDPDGKNDNSDADYVIKDFYDLLKVV